MQPSLLDLQSPTLTVADVTRHIRQVIDLDPILQDIWIEGEISNWSQAASGHIYFTLKDKEASLKCVVWRSSAQRLRYKPQGSGEAIQAHGRVSVYETGGVYQLYVDDIQPAGIGALYAEFERLKNQLADEGLFAAEYKQALPAMPNRIGVVTSPIAAALQDVLTVLERRYPVAEVILAPTPVQGHDAPPKIVAALNQLLTLKPPVDVILLVRGGGSIEDLWAFNDESLARTIAAAAIPIVAGVGHETDFTIADFVADHRAPTPTAAAELATPDLATIQQQLAGYKHYLTNQISTHLNDLRANLHQLHAALRQHSPQTQIDHRRQQVDEQSATFNRLIIHKLRLEQERLTSARQRLQTLNPTATLARGYAIIRKETSLIHGVNEVQPGDIINVTLHDGNFEATVQ